MLHLQVTFCTEKQLPSNQHWQAPAESSTYIPLAARHASFVFASYIPTPSAAFAPPLNTASGISIQRLQSHQNQNQIMPSLGLNAMQSSPCKNCKARIPGLQMNLADSERMAGTLESAGYTCAADASDADVIVYNTCSIRDKVRHAAAISLCVTAKQHHAEEGASLADAAL